MILLVKAKDELTDKQFEELVETLRNLGMDLFVCLAKAKFIVGKIEDRKAIEQLEPVAFCMTEQEFAASLLHPNQIA